MRFPPSIVYIFIREQNKTKFRFWFPLILLWPFIYLFGLAIMFFALIYFLIRSRLNFFINFLNFSYEILMLFHALRGLKINVQDKKSRVKILFA